MVTRTPRGTERRARRSDTHRRKQALPDLNKRRTLNNLSSCEHVKSDDLEVLRAGNPSTLSLPHHRLAPAGIVHACTECHQTLSGRWHEQLSSAWPVTRAEAGNTRGHLWRSSKSEPTSPTRIRTPARSNRVPYCEPLHHHLPCEVPSSEDPRDSDRKERMHLPWTGVLAVLEKTFLGDPLHPSHILSHPSVLSSSLAPDLADLADAPCP